MREKKFRNIIVLKTLQLLRSCLEIFRTLWILFGNVRNYSTRKKVSRLSPKKVGKVLPYMSYTAVCGTNGDGF